MLPTDVPNGKVHILILDCLYIDAYMEYESDSMVCRYGLTNCRYGCDYLSQLELVETTNKLEGYRELRDGRVLT